MFWEYPEDSSQIDVDAELFEPAANTLCEESGAETIPESGLAKDSNLDNNFFALFSALCLPSFACCKISFSDNSLFMKDFIVIWSFDNFPALQLAIVTAMSDSIKDTSVSRASIMWSA